MKTTLNIIVCLLSFLLISAAQATQNIATEFWISTNATGNFYTSGAGGTIDNPLDGSTQAYFDSNMNSLPANSTIHILAGTYTTKGLYGGFSVKSGQNIVGSGIDVTTLQFPAGLTVGGSGAFIIGSVTSATNIVISDLTCDCNKLNNTDTYSGIGLDGTGNAVRRVKVINCGKYGGSSEAWGITLGNSSLPYSVNNIIEDCEVSHFTGGTDGGGISAIAFDSNSGIIRNNYASLPIGGGFFAINIQGSHEVLVEGNYVNGASVGVHSDTGYSTNIMITHNTFLNVGYGVNLTGQARNHITIDFNTISLTNAPGGNSTYAFGTWLNTTIYTNITIIGNNVKYVGSVIPYMTALNFFNTSGVIFTENKIDPILTNSLYNCTGVNIDNNYDLNGNYRYDMNMPTVGNTPVTAFGLDLVGSAGASPALVYLGLPSNPLLVLTNQNVGPVTLNGGLTNNGNFQTAGNVTITNANNWASLSMTPTNATISVHGVVVAMLQTNGVLNAYNGLATTTNNVAGTTQLYSGTTSYTWTNNYPQTMVVYIYGSKPTTITYNGNDLFGTNVSSATVIMQPNSRVQITSGSTFTVNRHVL